MSSTTLPVCPKTGSTSPASQSIFAYTLLREIGNAPVGLLCALSASGATCSTCRSASKEGASPRPDDSGVHVGVRVRIICSSALEGQTGTVTSADDQQQVVTVRIDSDLRHVGGPIRLKLAEVEPVTVARDSR